MTIKYFIRRGAHSLFLGLLLAMVWGCEENLPEGEVIYTPLDLTLQAYIEANKVDSSMLIDSSAQHVLLIGDSMADGLRHPFSLLAKQNGHKFTAVAKTSSSILAWQGKRMKALIEELKPTYVMVSLGSNELFTRQLEAYKKFVKRIVDQIGEVNFIWIGPPNWRKDNGLTGVLAEGVGEGRFFPSQDLVLKRAGDGIHPRWKEYEKWANAISGWIMTESKQKILMKVPEKVQDSDNKL
ncbi:hypothetical protein [uncultured Microscilla sp.]|uniref:hypothetical protein n=1 Tax=uncultured Microscilla sp. TaxID=432653 RepID=UPI00262CBBF3|nr:hypothetical protein [uncultured Microscilla sp.]